MSEKQTAFRGFDNTLMLSEQKMDLYTNMDTRILEFASRHISAQESGLDSLCRFLSFNSDSESVAKHKLMLTDGWLYHTTSDTLNDPHDLQFDLKWPELEDTEEIDGFVDDVKVILSLIDSQQVRKGLTLQDLLRDESLKNNLNAALRNLYSQVRVCCFTTNNENPLFWAHYANSHKGYCIRFRVNKNPHSIFSNTRKIHYSSIYPTIKFPMLTNLISALSVILQKSETWQYENEYRSMFCPDWQFQLKNNGDSLSLHNDDISDIYFGMHMPEENKKLIIKLVEAGPFKPTFWNTATNKKGFHFEFSKYDF